MIAKPPWTQLGKKLESTLRKAIFDFDMIDGSPLSVALSGGKDSLTLLFLLHAVKGRGFADFPLHAIHVDGPFSCGAGVDKQYLQKICLELAIPFHIASTHQSREALACYSCSRTRRSLIFDKAKEIGSSTIAFGHHRDDSAQTLLMNLLHKAEFAAMLPKVFMHAYNIHIIRPLIYISEQDISSFASLYQFKRITCQCPIGQTSLRKQTDRLLQDLETIFPNARTNIAQAGLLYGSKKALLP